MESLSIVIIEDDEAHFELMKRAIDRAIPSASVDYFEDAGACLERLDKITPDVIITDYLIPGMNGLEFLEALKKENKDIPVVMITGQGDENIAVQAMKLGAWDYMVKSADFFTLLPSVIEKVVGERKLKESLQRSENRFKEIFEKSPIGIELYDLGGRLIDANKSCLEIFGASNVADIEGLRLFDNPNVSSDAKTRLLKGETVKYEAPFDFEKVKKLGLYKTKRSGTIYLNVVITPMCQAADDCTSGYLVQVRDITGRKRAEQHIRTLSQQLIKAQESECQRLSRDLHDMVGQELSALKIGLDTLLDDQPEAPLAARQRLPELSGKLQQTITAVRGLAYNLRPADLDQLGLLRAVQRHCEEFSAKHGLKVDFSAAGMDELELDFESKTILYRLIQEALNNVKKHADAGRVTIRLVASFPNIILRIEDDGKGFDVKDRLVSAADERRMGLRSMEERVALLQGNMTIESRPMRGTRILIEIPCR